MTTVTDPLDEKVNLKFELQWTDDDAAWVVARWDLVGGEDMGPVRIATLGWNGGEWWFWPLDQSGEIHHSARRFMDVDTTQRLRLHNLRAEARQSPDAAITEAKDAATDVLAKQYRDEQKEIAVIGAKRLARAWFPFFEELQSGCTGAVGVTAGRFVTSHDGDTCPVHEDAAEEAFNTDQLIREYRSEGWTYDEIASQLGVARSYVERIVGPLN